MTNSSSEGNGIRSPILRALQHYRESAARDGLMPSPFQPSPAPHSGSKDVEDTSTGGKSSARILSKFIDGKRVMPPLDAAPPLAPSHDPSSNGYPAGSGLAGWIAAAASIDPDNPDRFALSPRAQDVNRLNRDDPALPWYLQGR